MKIKKIVTFQRDIIWSPFSVETDVIKKRENIKEDSYEAEKLNKIKNDQSRMITLVLKTHIPDGKKVLKKSITEK